MAGAKTGSNKNKSTLRIRKLDGKVVRAVLYNGKHSGNGKYFAGEIDGVLVLNEAGVPIPLREIGSLE